MWRPTREDRATGPDGANIEALPTFRRRGKASTDRARDGAPYSAVLPVVHSPSLPGRWHRL